MKKNVLCLTLLGMTLSATSALAANYGTAGCGLGAMAFRDEPGKIQLIAATLNNLISPQTSAITSGTSNCNDDNPRDQASLFIIVNQVALQKDISRGNGETLANLSQILMCSDSEKLNRNLQHNYQAIFPSSHTTATDVNRSIDQSIQSDHDLVKTCKIYG